MRSLSDTFLADLQTGFLCPLKQAVVEDSDLNLEIRERYLNIYHKGHSLLRLEERQGGNRYRAEIHPKFSAKSAVPTEWHDAAAVDLFLLALPQLKYNIARLGTRSLEIEYEQMIIRANNCEPRNASEYFIVDRQYAIGMDRFDLTGFFWPRSPRRSGQTVAVCFWEIKFALNTDISEVHDQLQRYYDTIRPQAAEIAEEAERILRQKLTLGLYRGTPERLAAMQTLRFTRDIEQFQFVLALVDYNPNSTRLSLHRLAQLPFAKQVRIFHGGFAMWQQNIVALPPPQSRPTIE